MTALAIDQHQHLVATQTTKLWRTNKCPAIVNREAPYLELRQQRLDDVEHVVGRDAFQVLPVEYIDRHGRICGSSTLATGTNDYYFVERLIHFFLSNRNTG